MCATWLAAHWLTRPSDSIIHVVRHRSRILTLVIPSASVLTLLLIFCCSPGNKTEETRASTPYRNHSDSATYVGIEACHTCHADMFETFLHTGMGQSFGRATKQKSSGRFNNIKPVYDNYKDLYYYPYWQGENMFLMEYRLQGKDTVHKRTEKISYIIGSGHHTNSHFTEENGYVYQAPLTFYTQEGKWDMPPGFEHGNNTRFSRRIGLECMSCHNALPEIVAGSENRYTQIPLGISCERCHGPGSIHVEEKMKGYVVDTKTQIDYTIVNPSKLPWKRQIDICQRCHLQGNIVMKPGKNFHDFRPGMQLSEVFDVFSPKYEGEGDFIMAAHAERFQQSQCFIKSNTGDINTYNPKLNFTCISCHNPHVSVRVTNTDNFNNTCRNCHSAPKTVCSETDAEQKKQEYSCVTCHMPQRGAADIPHVSVHDHYIRKPEKNTDMVSAGNAQPVGLVCVTSKKPDIRTLAEAYVSYYEKFDRNPVYLKKAMELVPQLSNGSTDNVIVLIHLYYTKDDYAGIIALAGKIPADNKDGWTAFRISKAYENTGRLAEAETWIDRACETEAENLEFLLQKGIIKLKRNKIALAREQFLDLNKRYSKHAKSWAYLGYTWALERQWAQAKQAYMKALALDPDLELALINLADLYQATGDTANLKLILQRIIKVNPKNENAKLLLQRIS